MIFMENTQQHDSNESFAIVVYKNQMKIEMILIFQISIKGVFQQVEMSWCANHKLWCTDTKFISRKTKDGYGWKYLDFLYFYSNLCLTTH